MTWNRFHALAVCGLLCSATLAAAQSPVVVPLRMAWSAVDHPSAVYHAKESGTLQVEIENPGDDAAILQGALAFGERPTTDPFRPLSTTPLKPTRIAPHALVKITLPVTFAAAGSYTVRWVPAASASTSPVATIDIPGSPSGPASLECIFAPRTAPGSPLPGDPRWLATLPPDIARTPGALRDLASQTGIQKFLLDERFAFDDQTGVTLPPGTSLGLSPEALDTLFAEAATAHVAIILRITVPMTAADAREVEALHQYVADVLRRAKGSLLGLVIAPENNQADRATFRAFYLAAYGAAKGVSTGDRNLAMLGAGSAAATRDLLLAEGLGLRDYVDAIAVTDTTSQIAAIAAVSKLPIWVLPPTEKDPWSAVPAAIALAQGAAVVAVPPPGVDRGVVEHLLGGAAWYQTLAGTGEGSPAALPYAATFQGDGYAVAAVAGLGAGTPIDAFRPGLAHTRTVVSAATGDGLPPYPQIEIGDSTGSMRVVDAQGTPADCRQGDTLYVPATDRPVYVLQSGSAEDLMGVLRSARPHHLPVLEITLQPAADPHALALRLTNITDSPRAGALRLLATQDKTVSLLGEARLDPLPPGKPFDVSIPLVAAPPRDGFIIAEFTTAGPASVVQRTALHVP